MAVSIRLSRQGAKKNPQYMIVVSESQGKRDGEYLEKLGYYYPKAKTAKEKVKVDLALVEKWRKAGAQPTQTVGQLLKLAAK